MHVIIEQHGTGETPKRALKWAPKWAPKVSAWAGAGWVVRAAFFNVPDCRNAHSYRSSIIINLKMDTSEPCSVNIAPLTAQKTHLKPLTLNPHPPAWWWRSSQHIGVMIQVFSFSDLGTVVWVPFLSLCEKNVVPWVWIFVPLTSPVSYR